MEEARRDDVDLLPRKASEEEVTPIPDLKAIVSASSDYKVETKKTVDDIGNNELETKMTAEVKIKAAEGDKAVSEVRTKTMASSVRREPTMRSPTLKHNVHRCLLWPKFMPLNCVLNVCKIVWIVLRDLW